MKILTRNAISKRNFLECGKMFFIRFFNFQKTNATNRVFLNLTSNMVLKIYSSAKFFGRFLDYQKINATKKNQVAVISFKTTSIIKK